MAADLERLTQIARTHYNVANPTTPISQDTAYRAVILGLLAILNSNASSAGTITDKV
jgi:hypothetical protein